jgi:hypothetical protein
MFIESEHGTIPLAHLYTFSSKNPRSLDPKTKRRKSLWGNKHSTIIWENLSKEDSGR